MAINNPLIVLTPNFHTFKKLLTNDTSELE
jgi:hypothetical protein